MAKKDTERDRYAVDASLDNVSLTRAGSSVRLQIYDRGTKIGELEIGRGSIFWWGAGRKKRKRLRWSRVAEELNLLPTASGSASGQ